LLSQPFVTNGVMVFLPFAVMRRAIKFHDQTVLNAEKVDNVSTNGHLPSKFQSVERRRPQ